MKLMKKTSALIILFSLLAGFPVHAQSAGSAATDSIAVSATVGQGISSINVVQGSLNFGTLTPTAQNSRYLSQAITISYFAANGPWEIRAYTTRADQKQGLVNADATSTVLLKITPGVEVSGGTYEYGDVNDNAEWSGGDGTLKFFTILDDGAMTNEENPAERTPFYAVVASTENENPDRNDEFRVKFGIDISGAASQQHLAVVTFDLAIL
jgi:hypothetical protein